MEISLGGCVYAINPRRIIAIENFYNRRVIIHMTDNFDIKYEVEDNSEYKKLRDELASIVGG
jgi:hypothetical protein